MLKPRFKDKQDKQDFLSFLLLYLIKENSHDILVRNRGTSDALKVVATELYSRSCHFLSYKQADYKCNIL